MITEAGWNHSVIVYGASREFIGYDPNKAKKCRGRNAGYPAPPAQIPACGITAPGSCLGSDAEALVCLPYPAQLARRAFRTLRSARGRLVKVPLGHGLSLHGLRRWLVMLFAGLSTFVRPLHRYNAPVRLPGRVRVGIAACAFSDRTGRGIRPIASGISRLPCKAFVYMPWFLDSAGPDAPLAISRRAVRPSHIRNWVGNPGATDFGAQ